MSISDVAAKLNHRGRGLDQLEKRVGAVCSEIEGRLPATTRTLRVLEVGCGFGVALMQLRQRFGHRIDLIGTNKDAAHGDLDMMIAASLLRDVCTLGEVLSVVLPTLIYWDDSQDLPFDDRSFDLVFSQMCFQYLPDKMRLLREVARVLRDDGVAKIHAPLHDPGLPPQYACLLDICEEDACLKLGDYLGRWKGQTGVQLGYHSSVRLSHCQQLGAELELVSAIRLGDLYPTWKGVKSVYRRSA